MRFSLPQSLIKAVAVGAVSLATFIGAPQIAQARTTTAAQTQDKDPMHVTAQQIKGKDGKVIFNSFTFEKDITSPSYSYTRLTGEGILVKMVLTKPMPGIERVTFISDDLATMEKTGHFAAYIYVTQTAGSPDLTAAQAQGIEKAIVTLREAQISFIETKLHGKFPQIRTKDGRPVPIDIHWNVVNDVKPVAPAIQYAHASVHQFHTARATYAVNAHAATAHYAQSHAYKLTVKAGSHQIKPATSHHRDTTHAKRPPQGTSAGKPVPAHPDMQTPPTYTQVVSAITQPTALEITMQQLRAQMDTVAKATSAKIDDMGRIIAKMAGSFKEITANFSYANDQLVLAKATNLKYETALKADQALREQQAAQISNDQAIIKNLSQENQNWKLVVAALSGALVIIVLSAIVAAVAFRKRIIQAFGSSPNDPGKGPHDFSPSPGGGPTSPKALVAVLRKLQGPNQVELATTSLQQPPAVAEKKASLPVLPAPTTLVADNDNFEKAKRIVQTQKTWGEFIAARKEVTRRSRQHADNLLDAVVSLEAALPAAFAVNVVEAAKAARCVYNQKAVLQNEKDQALLATIFAKSQEVLAADEKLGRQMVNFVHRNAVKGSQLKKEALAARKALRPMPTSAASAAMAYEAA